MYSALTGGRLLQCIQSISLSAGLMTVRIRVLFSEQRNAHNVAHMREMSGIAAVMDDQLMRVYAAIMHSDCNHIPLYMAALLGLAGCHLIIHLYSRVARCPAGLRRPIQYIFLCSSSICRPSLYARN